MNKMVDLSQSELKRVGEVSLFLSHSPPFTTEMSMETELTSKKRALEESFDPLDNNFELPYTPQINNSSITTLDEEADPNGVNDQLFNFLMSNNSSQNAMLENMGFLTGSAYPAHPSTNFSFANENSIPSTPNMYSSNPSSPLSTPNIYNTSSVSSTILQNATFTPHMGSNSNSISNQFTFNNSNSGNTNQPFFTFVQQNSPATPTTPSTPITPAEYTLQSQPLPQPKVYNSVVNNGQLQTQTTNKKASQKLLEDISEVLKQVTLQMDKLFWEQKNVSIPIPQDNFIVLDGDQKKIKEAIDWADKQLNRLLDSMYLDPKEMSLLLQRQQELFVLMKQIEVYISELQNIQKGLMLPSYALVIVSQPFPDSIKQHKNIEEPVGVKLLTGAKFDSRPPCIIKAELINFNSKSKKNTIGIENSEKSLNEKTGLAQFSDLKFPHGTRLKSIRLKFIAKIVMTDNMGQVHTLNLESNPTNSIVVKTNENQWHEAEGILLKKTAFGGSLEIQWYRFSNWLQRRYLNATKQDLQNPVRPLTIYDVQYIHKIKFSSKPTIHHKDFEVFWEWYGPLTHKIRYQRHISTLWSRGLIAGFLTREECELVLSREQVGTFLIRFSEREPQHVISYLSQVSNGQTQVKHYLLKNDDTHGAKKTLPDFLYGYTELTCILQIENQGDKRILRRCDKNTVLKEFYSKKSSSNSKGYDDVVMVTEQLSLN